MKLTGVFAEWAYLTSEEKVVVVAGLIWATLLLLAVFAVLDGWFCGCAACRCRRAK